MNRQPGGRQSTRATWQRRTQWQSAWRAGGHLETVESCKLHKNAFWGRPAITINPGTLSHILPRIARLILLRIVPRMHAAMNPFMLSIPRGILGDVIFPELLHAHMRMFLMVLLFLLAPPCASHVTPIPHHHACSLTPGNSHTHTRSCTQRKC